MANPTLEALNATQVELLSRYDGEFTKLEDKANGLKVEWQQVADDARDQIDTTNQLVNDKIDWADKEMKDALSTMPIINLFTNPSLETDSDGNVLGLSAGVIAHLDISIEVEQDTNTDWWRPGGNRLHIKATAHDDDSEGWFSALQISNVGSIPTNANGVPLTYSFEYKVINRTSDKSNIKIGWERGEDLNSEPSDDWKKAYFVYTIPGQRGFFMSVYPGEKAASIEILVRNIVIAPGIVGDKFSNYTF